MTIVVPNQKLVFPTSSSDKSNETSAKIPTDAKGIQEYLECLPDPIGYRMLVRPYSGESKTKGGLILSEQTQDTIAMTTVIGIVVKMGDLCYLDKEKFNTDIKAYIDYASRDDYPVLKQENIRKT